MKALKWHYFFGAVGYQSVLKKILQILTKIKSWWMLLEKRFHFIVNRS